MFAGNFEVIVYNARTSSEHALIIRLMDATPPSECSVPLTLGRSEGFIYIHEASYLYSRSSDYSFSFA